MKALAKALSVAVLCGAALPALAATSAVSIGADGAFSGQNILVYQVSGSAVYCRAVWGSAFVRLTLYTSAATQILKNHGASARVDDLKAGDYIAVQGALALNADSLLVNVTKIIDGALNEEDKTLSGTIVKLGDGSFILSNKTFGATTTVTMGTSTIQKGVRTITPAELKIGDKVTSVSGAYDYAHNTFKASAITVYQDASVFAPRNFQGKLQSVEGTSLPATITVSAEGTDYRVYLPAGASILSSSRAATQLSRFAAGDTVRFFGSIRQNNLAEIDASILRDINF